ncbi:MAG: hypothetical protein GX808_08420, partial [Syntrophomonadaceae bacterium]|nr:hypothetical protein [Syntrophomonadaceae bacterium]
MKKVLMFKKLIALLLIISFSFLMVPPVWASDFTEEELTVSDEFVAQYPHGAFSLAAVKIQTHEYSGRTMISIIRQGGREGSVSVTVKAVDISSKYGQDYYLSLPGFLFDQKIAGDETTPAILANGLTEVSVNEGMEENADRAVDMSPGEPKDETVDNNDEDASYETIGNNQEEAVYEPFDNNEEDSPYETIDNNDEEASYEIIGDSEEEDVDNNGENIVKDSPSNGLRAVKEQAMGKPSDREKYSIPDSQELEQLNTAMAAADDFYAQAPGTEFTLSFADGERVKSFYLNIINDNLPEAQEQIVFVITDVTDGGVIGLQKETTVNIIDDEPYETPVLRFAEHSFTTDGESAQITLTRTAGVNYYAGARIYTIGDSARPGTDYTELGQKILFLPGQRELSLEIPVVKNNSAVDKYFYVKLEPDQSVAVLGDEVVQVLIPGQLLPNAQAEQPAGTMAAQAVQEGEIYGVEKIIISADEVHCTEGSEDNWHSLHPDGWYESICKYNGNWSNTVPKDEENKFYLSTLESAFADVEYYKISGSNKNGWMDLGFNNNKTAGLSGDNGGRNKKLQFWSQEQDMNDDLKDYTEKAIPWIHCESRGAYFAGRVYSLEMYYRYFEFDIKNATAPEGEPLEYTFDFSKKEDNYTEEKVNPGTIEISGDWDGKQRIAKGFYTSADSLTFTVKAKNVRENWCLKGVRFVNPSNHGDYKYFDLAETSKIVIDHKWLQDADTYSQAAENGRKFLVQPVFDRKEAGISVYIWDSNKNKGDVLGMSDDGHIYDKDKTNTIYLHVGDKVILNGVGYNGYMVAGYNVSYNGQAYHSESGSQNAGIHTVTLTEKVKVTPFFGAQQLHVKRDPDNQRVLPGLQGTITYGGQTTSTEGQLEDIKSGQYVEFVSIPPVGYTTQWANRTGDTNGNGVLDEEEIRDPETGELYRQFDYDGDGVLDAEYDTPMFGDLFGYKVNQPNPLFYYYYVPMTGQTIYKGPVSGRVTTREYTIRKGYSQVKNNNGEDVDKLVPVAGAAVKMGGSYDPDDPHAQMGYGTATDSRGRFKFDTANLIKNGYYLLTVDYGGVSYVDKINPSATKELILPTFTSMKPISINGSPQNGEDSSVVAGSVVMLQDKTVDFTLRTASLENNVQVKKAIFRIYSPNGTFLSEKEVAVGDEENKFVYTANLNEVFT